MKGEQELREILINNTIRIIAEGGFEKATTKAITYSGGALETVRLNEVYIYRIFGSKEDLYEIAFETLDNEFILALCEGIKQIGGLTGDIKAKLYELFLMTWQFVLNNEPHCRCYIRYYYSIYFKGSSLEKHNRLFGVLLSEFEPLFKDEADVRSIMHSVLTTLLDFAVRVYNGDLENSEINIPHVFNVLYCMMATYFKSEIT